MTQVKILQVSHVSEKNAASRLEEEINSFITKEIVEAGKTLIKIQYSSASNNNKLSISWRYKYGQGILW